MELFQEILISGIRESLIWLPFVIGIGILQSYLKVLDISIDGIVILSGVFCAFIWNYTDSYLISITSTVLVSILLALIVYSFIFLLRINAIMVGIIFSFAAHSISVILVGESVTLNNTALFTDFLNIPLWLILLIIVIIVFIFLFFKSYIGTEIRGFGDNKSINTKTSPSIIPLIAYILVGALYGIGASFYVHSEGNARSGGSFEFLIVSLGSFLAFDKLFSFNKQTAFARKFAFLNTVTFKSIIGTLFFQLIIILVIFYTSNPIYWKLIFSAFLFIVLVPFNGLKIQRLRKNDASKAGEEEIVITNLCMSYDLGSEARHIFKELEITFKKGINVIRGPNGTGKTTLLKILNGKVRPQRGAVNFNRINLLKQESYKRDVYLLEQNPFNIIASNLTLIENLSIAIKNNVVINLLNGERILHELKKRLDTYGILPIFDIESSKWSKKAITLSGGEAQMLCVYMSLLSNKSILLFDEPTTGLDDFNFKRLLEILGKLKENKIILITSHDKRLDNTCDHSFYIEDYKIKSLG